jgi:hypothetical protein
MAASLLRKIFSDNDETALKLYIRRGYSCDVKESEPPHLTLLHVTARLTCSDSDKASTMKLLLDEGAPLHASDDFGVNALTLCALHGC